MARQPGTRNQGYAARRAELLVRLRARLHARGETRASWRELADAAEVSLSTLNHYFGRRDDVMRAVMADDRAGAAGPLAAMAAPGEDFAASVRGAVLHLADGLRHGGLTSLFATGLAETLKHPSLGPVFLAEALEPTLEAVEQRLVAHMALGQMQQVDPRGPAIALVSPVLVAFLHQQELGGCELRPLDLDAFVDEHVDAYVRAWSFQSG